MNLWSIAALVLVLNLPFGYWRANADKFSRQWFLAVHVPVPCVITIRLLSGLGWHLSTFPVMIGSFFAGQYLGGMLHELMKQQVRTTVTACLVMDIAAGLGLKRGDIG